MNEPIDPEDALFGRVLDREDDAAVWRELDQRASADPMLWQRLAQQLRDEAWLRSTLAPELARAEQVELPQAPRRAPASWFAWGGWFAAAIFATFALTAGGDPPVSPALAGAQLDPIVLEARPASTGEGYEVLLLRRAVERTHVDDVYRLAWDELGQPRPVPVTLAPPPIRADF
jgi:hypothetical protein